MNNFRIEELFVKGEPLSGMLSADAPLSATENASASENLEAFQQWLRQQLGRFVRGKTQEQLWDEYIRRGFAKGAGRAFDDVRKPPQGFNRKRSKVRKEQQAYAKQAAADQSTADFYAGSKADFLQSAFGQPVAKEKVQLMASQAFDDLEGVTDDLGLKMGRLLTDGLVQGKHPNAVASEMAKQCDISLHRAKVVSRTKLLEVHNSGQLLALKGLGVKRLGVNVEWLNGSTPCPICAERGGDVYTIEEAEGVLPFHPQCVCCWAPSFEDVGESEAEDEDEATENANPNHDELGRFAESTVDTSNMGFAELLKHVQGRLESVFGVSSRREGDELKLHLPGNRMLKAAVKEDKDDKPMVRLDFETVEGNLTHSEESLQSGTMDFFKRLGHFAKQMHADGVKMEVIPSDARRARVYAKLLARAGLKLEREEGSVYAAAKKQVWNLSHETVNVNPEGCNQFTGPGCSVSSVSAVTTAQESVAKLEAEVAPHLEANPTLREVSKQVAARVAQVGKSAAAKGLSALALKTCDQWLFEMAVNAHQPGTTLIVKVTTLATVKTWLRISKLRAKMTANAEDDEATNLKAVMDALAAASGGAFESPSLEEVREWLAKEQRKAANDD